MNDEQPCTILLIEDDLKLAELITSYLGQKGFIVNHAEDGQKGLELAEQLLPQLIILDLMLPHVDGLTVCRKLQAWYQGSLLVLTASGDDMDQVAVLEMGADDFVSKPIHPRVLLARVRALLRRYEKNTDTSHQTPETNKDQLTFDSLMINMGRRQVELAGEPVKLTETELELLWLLANNPEKPVSRDQISQSLRGIEYDGQDRSIDNKIVSLRKKLGDSHGLPRRIITVRGKGYLFITDQWQVNV
ncbi:response regulator transcription factor [Marinomonas transparens]|uniref:Response regulator transcription factor n=1 Tax=Marinomonas transparens TaxID=2795388 RepID=A0A934JNU8_9GAMM|nr:response regulator transcription factor [Marinomonas transparens]MBJ7537898.1 response regulator transcription factor [Marinomonas transparens]